MAYDANLILKGLQAGAYVDVDTNDTAATALTAVLDGNVVVDLGNSGTDMKGLDCVVILHDAPTDYTHTCDIVIQDSDHLAGGWQDVLTFPRLYAYMREVIGTATTAFTAAADFGVDLSEAGATYDGHIVEFSRELLTVGGTGKIWIAMQDSGDTYVTSGDVLTSDGGGVATQVGAARVIQTPLILVRKLATPKRYVRCSLTVTSGANFGDMDIMLTGSQHSYVNNLYM